MRKRVIFKNFRRPFPFFVFKPLLIRKNHEFTITRKIKFTESCIYDGSEGGFGKNKLFGFGIGFGLRSHHNTSFRFGYDCVRKKLRLLSYEYINGIRLHELIVDIIPDKWYGLTINYKPERSVIIFEIYDGNETHKLERVVDFKKWQLGYGLGMYFGGQRKAPHKMVFYEIK